MSRILIVEDEAHLADGLRFNLEAEGYQVGLVDSGEQALALLQDGASSFDLLVLDVMLPGKDGFAVMTDLRAAGQFLPTLILTARGHPDDVLRGFASGADDYLAKPFELTILLARINGLLRRREWLQAHATSHGTGTAPEETHASPEVRDGSEAGTRDSFAFGDGGEKEVDFNLLRLSVHDRVYQLTLMEANVLRYLIEHEGKPVSRRDMIQEVWGLQGDTDTRPIDNFIVRLRRYIEDDPTSPRHLLTVRGVGYRFIATPAVMRQS